MKFSIALFALLSAVPYVVQGYALPNAGNNTLIETVRAISSDGLVEARADDDWTMVLYTGVPSGGQCGGTSETNTGSSGGGCFGLAAKFCADLKVNVNVGIASCNFNFKLEGADCSGNTDIPQTVTAGTDNNGVALGDEIKFVSVECKLE